MSGCSQRQTLNGMLIIINAVFMLLSNESVYLSLCKSMLSLCKRNHGTYDRSMDQLTRWNRRFC